MRRISFGQEGNALLEKILQPLRTNQILKHIADRDSIGMILDIGCGYNAELLNRLIHKFKNVNSAIGLDLAVNKASDSQKIRLIEGDLNQPLSLPDNTFDLVTATAVLEHIDNYSRLINEIHRVLKPGGILFLTTPAPTAKPILEFLAFTLRILDEVEIRDHKNYFSKKTLQTLLNSHRFKEITVGSFQLGLNNFAYCKK